MPEEVRGRLMGVVEGCTNPESAELLDDGETVVFGNCRLRVGYPWFRNGNGIVYLQGGAFVSQARLGEKDLTLVERTLIGGLTATLGCDVLRVPIPSFPAGTVFMCEGGNPTTADGEGLIDSGDPGIIAFDGRSGPILARISLGPSSPIGVRFNGLEQPNGLAIDGQGNLYVGDIPNTNPDTDPAAPPPVPPAVYRLPAGDLEALAAQRSGSADRVRRVIMPNYVNGLTISPIDGLAYAVSCWVADPVNGGIYRLDDEAFATGTQPPPIHTGYGIQDGIGITRRGTILVSSPRTGQILGVRPDGTEIVVRAEGLPTRMPADFNVVYPKVLGGEPALLVTDISVGREPGDATVSAVDVSGL